MSNTKQSLPEQQGRSDIFRYLPQDINVVPEFNSRVDFGDMEELKASILANGVLQPIRVFTEDNKFWLIDGHRRHRACMELSAENPDLDITIPVLKVKKPAEEQRILDMLNLNTGKPLNAVEKADAITRLHNFLKPKQIADKLGINQSEVSKYLSIGKVPQRVKDMITSNQISHLVVYDLMKELKDPDKVAVRCKELLKQAQDSNNNTPKKVSGKVKKVAEGVHPTAVLFKKIVKKELQPVRNLELFEIVQSIFEGKLSKEELLDLFFDDTTLLDRKEKTSGE